MLCLMARQMYTAHLAETPAFDSQESLLPSQQSMQTPRMGRGGMGRKRVHRKRFDRNQRGFTLIELVVAMAVSLILVGILVRMFGSVSDGVTTARNIINVENRLRAAAQRLQSDLENVTLLPETSVNPESDAGYFTIIEGPKGPVEIVTGATDDRDDMLMFTVRSKDEPFVGRWQDPDGNTQIVESQVAEIAWFVRDGTLYRRVLLVLPDLPLQTPAADESYYALNDISAREVNGHYSNAASKASKLEPPPALVANTLGDLTNRENRFAHQPYTFPSDPRFWYTPNKNELLFPTMIETSSPKWPFPLTTAAGGDQLRDGSPDRADNVIKPHGFSMDASSDTGKQHIAKTDPTDYTTSDDDYNTAYAQKPNRYAEDVVLENVASFDVEVWDPGAPMVFAKLPFDPQHDANTASSAYMFDFGDWPWDIYASDVKPAVRQANYPINITQNYPRAQLFDSSSGYGWLPGAQDLSLVPNPRNVSDPVHQAARHCGTLHDTHNFMMLDGVRMRDGTFKCVVTPGYYEVEAWVGHTLISTDDCELRVNTQSVEINRGVDEWGPDTFQVVVSATDPTITVSLTDTTPANLEQTYDYPDPDETHSTLYSQLCGLIITPVGAASQQLPPPPTYADGKFDFFTNAADKTASGWVAATHDSPATSADGLLVGSWSPDLDSKTWIKASYADRMADDGLRVHTSNTFKIEAPFTGTFSIRVVIAGFPNYGDRIGHVWFNGTGKVTVSCPDPGPAWKAATGSVHVEKGDDIEIGVECDSSSPGEVLVAGIEVNGVADSGYQPPPSGTGGFNPNGVVLQPGQLGYYNGLYTAQTNPDDAQLSGFGAFVDLNYMSQMPSYAAGNNDPGNVFGNAGHEDSGLAGLGAITAATATGPPSIFDTWSTQYVRSDGTGSNAPPPYSGRIEAVQVRLRVLDPASQQLREVTVVQDFLDR